MIQRCMKKPEYYDALRYTEGDREEVFKFAHSAEFVISNKVLTLFVAAKQGPKKVLPGNYILKSSSGEISVYTQDEYEESFVNVKRVELK
jgi:hypothetical protein